MNHEYSLLLAEYYDVLQSSLDYRAWAEAISHLDALYQRRLGGVKGDGADGRLLLLDCGCGTGQFALAMANLGYDVIGIDVSIPMLQKAHERLAVEVMVNDILFLHQSMTTFELYGTVDLITANLDTVNHLSEIEEVKSWLRHCYHYLNEGALLIFDYATKHHFETTLAENTFVFPLQDNKGTMIWYNDFNQASLINEATLEWYIKATATESYERIEEIVFERYYDPKTLLNLAQEVGFETIVSLSETMKSPLNASDERQTMVWRKPILTNSPNL